MNTRRIRRFIDHNQNIISPVAIIGGFVVDIFTLNQIDQFFDNAILVAHLIIVGVCIALLFSKDTPFGDRINIEKRKNIVFTVMMFSFGGVFSGFFLFYTRSGTIASSAPFILLMLALMLGAEFLKRFYQKMTLQIAIYFTAIFAYMIFFVPIVINKISAGLFVISGVLSVGVMAGFLLLLRHIDGFHFEKYKKKFAAAVVMIFIGFNVGYFLNIIPPVPLSLKLNAVYHSVERTGNFQYTATYEPTPYWRFLKKRSRRVHWKPGEPVYVFTAIFTPADITTTIHHRWDYFDPEKTRWIPQSNITIDVTGGRNRGFRGFSYKENLWEGTWRVAVTNFRGQILGFVKFKIIETDKRPTLLTEKL
jgi:MFS family permease